MASAIISFLSDYGYQDEFVGVCHGVIARLCPQARVIDITHGVPRHDVRAGALALRAAVPFLPAGVHLAVVDPGVGATGEHARRAVAVRVAYEERVLVGPDNGLLGPAIQALDGAVEAVDVGLSARRLEPVSATFHGRDIFAPVAAALAGGEALAALGEPLAPGALRELRLGQATLRDDGLLVHVLALDHFGNLALDASADQLGDAGLRAGTAVELQIGGRRLRVPYALTFADVAPGELLLYEDSASMAALAVNLGSAATALGLAGGDELELRRAQHE
jgi:S-adenosylmethionine hydrolase